MNKYILSLKSVFKYLVWLFAFIGFALCFVYLAIKMNWTNEAGSDDINNRKYEEVSTNYENYSNDSLKNSNISLSAFILYKLMILNKYFPTNAITIYNQLEKTGNFDLANKMIQAAVIKNNDSLNLETEFQIYKKLFVDNNTTNTIKNAYDWVHLIEWQSLREAIVKDKNLIDSAGKLTGVEPRLITMTLIGEQIRLFNSSREMFKKVLGPLKILSVENNISYGVTGIKDFTAEAVEKNLKDTSSLYYIGKKYENLLPFVSKDTANERKANLVNMKNHFYSYLYSALILKQTRHQWMKSGYDISNRPEILATLFNVGFSASKPKSNPIVGGSRINIGEKEYTFGGIGFEFYYSGELADIFPYQKVKWVD